MPKAEKGLLPQRRLMALHFPRWASDCLRRHDNDLARLTRPLVLYERQANAMRLIALDEKASAAGLAEGQMLSDARAMCPDLIAREIDRGFLTATFAALADWHSNASPIVSVVSDWGAYGDLVLDITGVDHLFGGEAAMLNVLAARLENFSFAVQGAIAGSVGGALALSHFAPGQVVAGDIAGHLAPLPVSALRLEAEQIAGLTQMGLKTIGQLYGRDRRALQARFGGSLLLRLDQALGLAEERLVPRLPVPERMVERRFGEPIGLIDDVVMTAKDLAFGLAGLLEAEGAGARGFHLFLYRADHKMMVLSVNAARATREPGHIGRLFSNRIERLTGDFDAGFGIEMIRLAATEISPVEAVQTGVFGASDGAADLDRLVDRLISKLGPEAIVRTQFVNTHIPEQAVVLKPALAAPAAHPPALPDPEVKRPLRLLPQPEEIAVLAEVPDGPPARMEWRKKSYRFVKASGPERIGAEWWHPGETPMTRDYFVGEDGTGHRFWLFREGLYGTETTEPRWFLHGVFA